MFLRLTWIGCCLVLASLALGCDDDTQNTPEPTPDAAVEADTQSTADTLQDTAKPRDTNNTGEDLPRDTQDNTTNDTELDLPNDTQHDAPADIAIDMPLDTEEPETSQPITIGIEYISIEGMRLQASLAEALEGTGLTAVKPLPGNFDWGKMVSGPGETPNTIELDAFVTTWQAQGYTDIMLGLRSYCTWGSKDWGFFGGTNPSPDPDHMNDYRDWIRYIVERYDMDGQNDMPGLLYPIDHIEIGVEFSSFEPEPVNDYIEMLAAAYETAHETSDSVQVAHAAFFSLNVFRNNPPEEISYEEAFAASRIEVPSGNIRGGIRTLEEVRTILAASEHFDVLNIHALGDPTEIEGMLTWLRSETAGLPGYPKPVVISDTATEPFATLGPATICDAQPHQMSILVHPATEDDRCRLAEYFTRLIEGDEETIRWVQAFSARDMVKRTIIAAEQGATWINLWTAVDVPSLKIPFASAGAGNTAWAGLVEVEGLDLHVSERRAGFYAVAQLTNALEGYTAIRRIIYPDPRVRMYALSGPWDSERYIAWYQRERLVLPGDTIPTREIMLPITDGAQTAEVISRWEQTEPLWERVEPRNGATTVQITPTPLYIYPIIP